MSSDPLTLYLEKIARTSLLKLEDERALSQRAQTGDISAFNQLVQAHLRLVAKIAFEYKGFDVPIFDLICEGNYSLFHAIRRYAPDKGSRLSAYAAWWIRYAIKRYISTHSKTIRLPVHQIDRLTKIIKATARLKDTLGREPSDQEIATELKVPVHKIAHLRTVSKQPTSLHTPVKDDSSSLLIDVVCDPQVEPPSKIAEKQSLAEQLNVLLDNLEPRESSILRKRFGLNDESPQTLEEISQDMDITRERVRQIQTKALHKMRDALSEYERPRTKEEIRTMNLNKCRIDVLREFIKNNAA